LFSWSSWLQGRGCTFYVALFSYFNKDKKKTVKHGSCRDIWGRAVPLPARILGVKGVEVIILYPSGKVSDIQERQLTTLGQNIRARWWFFDDRL
jgi:threonine synthase